MAVEGLRSGGLRRGAYLPCLSINIALSLPDPVGAMDLLEKWLLASESQASSVLADGGLTVTAALGNPPSWPLPASTRNLAKAPGMGEEQRNKEALLAWEISTKNKRRV